jgi:MazG family protein
MEETFEALAALDAEDSDALQEELGDLLIQVVLHAQIASEEGEFRMQDVLRHVHQKLVHRHPHVFGDVKVKDAADVKFVWDRLKAAERAAGRGQNLGILDGVALALPALAQADAYQKRAARVGFDWPKLIGVIEKVHEELEEVRTAPDSPSQAAEIGDLLFTVVNLARWYEVDAESVLREANVRFRTRFEQLEKIVRQTGRKLVELSPEEMNEIWEKVK